MRNSFNDCLKKVFNGQMKMEFFKSFVETKLIWKMMELYRF